MKIDLHIHSKDCSDGKLPLSEIFKIAKERDIALISITDHDAIECQDTAMELAHMYGIKYITGLELNIVFSHPSYKNGKSISLDLLGYQYDIQNRALLQKVDELKRHRKQRAEQILKNINKEFAREGREPFTQKDLESIEQSVDGAFGRPHIANYMVKKGIVVDIQEAFDKYLVKCDVPKMPVSLEEASTLIREAGGKAVLAHPNDPNGTSLVKLTTDLEQQTKIIEEHMLPYIDGIECWHARHDEKTIKHYFEFARKHGLMVTGGSDCHQNPVRMGSLPIPLYVAEQFGFGNL